ncbi:MAG: FtsX-like permease family protein [Anaerolineae bacterium]
MNFLSVILVAAKRLWNNKGLTICSIVGLITAVALISSIPLYTDAANYKVLREELAGEELSGEGQGLQSRPPFAFMYRYIGAWHGAVETGDFDPVDEYITRSVPGIIDLPVETSTRYVKTDNFSLFPASEAEYIGIRQPLGWVNVGFVQDIQEHVHILEGSFPSPATSDAETMDVMISQAFVEETGLQVGERCVIFKRAAEEQEDSRSSQLRVRIAGVWAPKDQQNDFWFYNPQSLDNSFLVPEETFRSHIAPAAENEVYAAIWYIVFNGDKVRTDDVPGLLGRINYATTRVSTLLPNTTLDISPFDALQNYRWTTFVMTILLYVFSIPILLLVLYFISMISGLVVERQRGEISILKSRGAGDFQIIGIYALEGLMIGLVGLAVGLLIGRQLALVMGNTVSFLSFGQRRPLPVMITPRAIRLAALGVAVALLASLTPAMQAARLTIVTYKRERARAMEKPFWQRFFIDFLLLIPAGYGYYVLNTRGTISFLGAGGGGDPFNDPLLFLVPALTIFAVSLLIIRFFPLIMELFAWLTSQMSRAISIVLALRQLARVSRQYIGALLLLILTLSLATFTASMARTLDQSLIDRMYYRYGADYFLSESGESPEGEEDVTPEEAEETDQGWTFVPVSEHLKVPGINAATRVGSYPASTKIGGSSASGTFYGIDRLEFPEVGFFREDFAHNTLGGLMNRLALDRSAILVTPRFLSRYSLDVGDRVEVTVSVWGARKNIRFIIADTIEYFPTYYPEEDNEFLFVGNLDYVFEQMGGVFPYDVWIRTDPEVDPQEISRELRNYDINVVGIRGSREAINKEQSRPERTGVFGILSVGFMAAAILTVLGFLLHSFISFRQRFIEFGVLRAIGLSVGQMIGFLGFEQLLLIASGITAGTGLGVWVSRLFIPFLQVGAEKYADIPPFVVLIAWDDIFKIYMVFGVMLVGAIAGMIWFLLHLRIFEAVKLGEAV